MPALTTRLKKDRREVLDQLLAEAVEAKKNRQETPMIDALSKVQKGYEKKDKDITPAKIAETQRSDRRRAMDLIGEKAEYHSMSNHVSHFLKNLNAAADKMEKGGVLDEKEYDSLMMSFRTADLNLGERNKNTLVEELSNTWQDMDLERGREYSSEIGEKKTAAAWLRESQEFIQGKMNADYTSTKYVPEPKQIHKHIARMIAVQELAGKKGLPLDKVELSAAEANGGAYSLIQSGNLDKKITGDFVRKGLDITDPSVKEFLQHICKSPKDFYKEYTGEKKSDLVSDNEGSVVEDNHAEAEDIEEEAGTVRDQKLSDYIAAHQEDYIAAKHKPVLDEMLGIDDQATHAAKMYGAYQLKKDRGDVRITDAEVAEEAAKIQTRPAFRIIAADPKTLNLANMGKGMMMESKLAQAERDFAETVDPEKNMAARMARLRRSYEKLTRAGLGVVKSEKYVKSRSPEFQKMVKGIRAVLNEYDNAQTVSPSTSMKAMANILEYQTGKEQVRFWKSGQERFNLSMEAALSMTEGTAAERFVDTQITKVNKLRSDPARGSDAFMSKEKCRDKEMEIGMLIPNAARTSSVMSI